jgi:hypothetical protein
MLRKRAPQPGVHAIAKSIWTRTERLATLACAFLGKGSFMAIRYRRNINCLTTNQLHDFRESMQALLTYRSRLETASQHSAGYMAFLYRHGATTVRPVS